MSYKVPRSSPFERFDRVAETQPPSGRAFGFAFALLFASIGCLRALHGGEVRWWAVAISATLALTAAVRPALLDPAAAAWTIILRPIQQAVTIAAMAMLFFLVITPAGWLRRLLVHDPLRLRFDARATSYWQKRQTPSAETMTNQF
jgi:hypothetical protein